MQTMEGTGLKGPTIQTCFIFKSLSLQLRSGSNNGCTPKPFPLGGSSHSAAVLIEGDKAGVLYSFSFLMMKYEYLFYSYAIIIMQ